jgi:hypothetical protein
MGAVGAKAAAFFHAARWRGAAHLLAQTLQANSPGAAHANKAALHIGAETEPPRIAPARGPPLWDGCGVPMGDGVEIEPDWDEAAQPATDFGVDQRVSW